MKLPQYRLLKISASRKGTSIVAEWVDFVTCGECNEWNEYSRDNLGRCDCHLITTRADDFCSYGEREGE